MLYGWEIWVLYNVISYRYLYGFIYKLFCIIRGGGKKVVKNEVWISCNYLMFCCMYMIFMWCYNRKISCLKNINS